MDRQTIEYIGATAEVMGVALSPPALNLLIDDLDEYPVEKIKLALKRLRQDAARFTLSEIIKRMPGMWPHAEIAWSQAPRDEALTVITTREALAAWDMAADLDKVAGRMTFLRAYEEQVAQARLEGRQPEWVVSLGLDATLRDQVVMDAIASGVLPPRNAHAYLPHIPIDDLQRLADKKTTASKLLESHAQTVNNLDQLMLEAPVEHVASIEIAKGHLAGINALLKTPEALKRQQEQPAVSREDVGKVAAELEAIRKHHAERST